MELRMTHYIMYTVKCSDLAASALRHTAVSRVPVSVCVCVGLARFETAAQRPGYTTSSLGY